MPQNRFRRSIIRGTGVDMMPTGAHWRHTIMRTPWGGRQVWQTSRVHYASKNWPLVSRLREMKDLDALRVLIDMLSSQVQPYFPNPSLLPEVMKYKPTRVFVMAYFHEMTHWAKQAQNMLRTHGRTGCKPSVSKEQFCSLA